MVRNSILGRGVRVHTGAHVEGCVIMDNCDIGRHAKVCRAILDKNVRIPEGAGVDMIWRPTARADGTSRNPASS